MILPPINMAENRSKKSTDRGKSFHLLIKFGKSFQLFRLTKLDQSIILNHQIENEMKTENDRSNQNHRNDRSN